MKKLMTITLAACMAAGFSLAQTVTSANVVGYQNYTSAAGFTMYAPPFTTIGSTNIAALSSITGTFQAFDSLQVLDADANVVSVYTWLTPDIQATPVAYATWCDDSLNPIDVANLPQGFSYLLATADIVQVQNAGEVKDAAISISAAPGFASAGNGTPTDRMLSSLAFAGGIDNFDSIQFLDSNANVLNVYTWLTPDVQNPDTAVAYATWCDDSLNPVTGILVPAASGFLLETAGGCTMTIPSPFAP